MLQSETLGCSWRREERVSAYRGYVFHWRRGALPMVSTSTEKTGAHLRYGMVFHDDFEDGTLSPWNQRHQGEVSLVEDAADN